jgi:hypothetical protein
VTWTSGVDFVTVQMLQLLTGSNVCEQPAIDSR